ncbi:MarR family transcriptional regulator [Sphingomonas sp. S-NIH.Pt15_0812]|uniref:MarR family winged helix-turn-helix transcriptional regulator n=1 Tax=Sphingomonas sp. S-NIH.Pt15_0812 TaxID=1920129 RepID=UPI000F7DF6E9|nr:MarR family transcriptional regulator [Sphingomonas sp. S-NIH.Pt15_0812]RSU51146.1 MarR family transcriptional regulator [Sphingomonas sp. S-NIH.Pt15_0812]
MNLYDDDESFRPNNSIGYLIRRIHVMGAQLVEPIFAREGITGTQWSSLAMILMTDANTCVALARDMGYDKGAMTRVVDQLEERGLLRRARDDGDRRQINLSLTPEGREIALRCKRQVQQCWNAVLAEWDREELEGLIGGLQRLKATFENAVNEGGCA